MAIEKILKALLYLLLAAAAVFMIYNSFEDKRHGRRSTTERLVIDTFYVPYQEIKIIKAKAKIIRKSDTVFSSPAYAAVIDTVQNKDTVRLEYLFPENIFSMELKRAADTIYKERIIYASSRADKSKWYSPYLYALCGAAAGFLASELINK